jgi:hypothetical protein
LQACRFENGGSQADHPKVDSFAEAKKERKNQARGRSFADVLKYYFVIIVVDAVPCCPSFGGKIKEIFGCYIVKESVSRMGGAWGMY